ncbi:MAG: hypothetical protein WAX69_17430 [Victivallales bacterium]
MRSVDPANHFKGNPSDLFKMMGFALWQAQLFEEVLAIHLMHVLSENLTQEQAAELLEKHYDRTLGQLLDKLKNHCEVKPGFERRLEEFKKERNWLAHRIRREDHTAIYNELKFQELLNRLDLLNEEGKLLANIMIAMCEKWCIAEGVPSETLKNRREKTLQEWISQ